MGRKHKKIGSLLIAVLMLGMLFTAVGDSQAAKRVNLLIWSGYPEMVPFYEKVAKDYESLHPGVKIEVAAFGLRDFERKLSMAIPSGTESDIMEMSTFVMTKFVEAGYLSKNPPEVSQYIESRSILSIHRKDITFKGDTYGVPLFQGLKAMFWNKTMFAEAGLTHSPQTWEEVIDYSQKLAKYDEKGNLIRSGISLRLSGAGSGVAEKWWFWLWPAGGTLEEKTPSGKYHNGYNNQAGRDALRLYIDLLYKYGVDNYKIKHDAEAFALEKTAMFTRESWVVGYMKEHAPQVNYDVAVLPKYRRWGTLTEIKNLYVSKQCKNPDIAWGLVMYMQKPENLKFLLERVGWFPTRTDVDFEDVFNKIPQYRGFLSRPEGFELYMYYPIACGDEILTKLAERLVTAFTRKGLLDNPKGIAKVIEEAARQTDEILKEAGLYGVE